MLTNSTFLSKTFSETFIKSLCKLIKIKNYNPEEKVFSKGDRVDKLIFITKGEI